MYDPPKTHIIAATVASLGIGVAAFGAEPVRQLKAEPTPTQLREQIRTLQEHVERLEAATSRPGAGEVDGNVARISRDADARSHFLATDSSLTAGYDKGFFLKSTDGNFLLKPGVQAQFRYVANYRDEQPGGGDGDLEDGFEVRRLWLRFEGNVFSPELTYQLQWEVNRNGGDVLLLDAWAQYRFAEQWEFYVVLFFV